MTFENTVKSTESYPYMNAPELLRRFWYDAGIVVGNKITEEKMLSEGVEVHAHARNGEEVWTKPDYTNDTNHKALLINIQPIKKETAEDVLRAWLEYFKGYDNACRPIGPVNDLVKKTKAVLKEKTDDK